VASDEAFDEIVICAGPVGETAARQAVQGVSARPVERRMVGGEYNYYVCMEGYGL
jgi:pyruvate/2-oxoglutarate dehydrogenase complex dihydrolipoamide dehydrogenase (E3) component